jgi:hypothetical protein
MTSLLCLEKNGSVRKYLGDEQFQTLWQKGYPLSPEQVISYASSEE